MKCYIDIENSKTQKVETLYVNIIKYEEDKEIIFDISTLNSHELEILKDAINEELTYTDIEMFFIGESNIPSSVPPSNRHTPSRKYSRPLKFISSIFAINFFMILPSIKSNFFHTKF